MNYKFEDHIGTPIPLSKLWLKRICDIILALIGMVILAIAIVVFGPIIKLISPGPIFYSQKRVGYMGKPIMVHKFRSMRNDAEKILVLSGHKKMIQESLKLVNLCEKHV